MLVQYCRTDTTREWLDTTRTTRTGRETMVYGPYRSRNDNGDLHIISKTALLVRPVRVVKQWFTSRTIGELHIRYLHTNTVEQIRPVND